MCNGVGGWKSLALSAGPEQKFLDPDAPVIIAYVTLHSLIEDLVLHTVKGRLP